MFVTVGTMVPGVIALAALVAVAVTVLVLESRRGPAVTPRARRPNARIAPVLREVAR
jgi:hypothetical protein